jgi:hypothetical protein
VFNLSHQYNNVVWSDLQSRRDHWRLRVVPQRQRGDRPDNAAAYSDRDTRVQQLPHQHDGVDDLHDEPYGG